jgi:AhpD family alkylhydroperoxidase
VADRIIMKQLEPGAYTAMLGMEAYLKATGLDPKLKELIKIRASRLNGCSYCITMHEEMARALGESEARLRALEAWQDSALFTDQERALLAVTDEVTLTAGGGMSDETYQAALDHVGENTLAQIIMVIVTINAWNRIALSTQMPT